MCARSIAPRQARTLQCGARMRTLSISILISVVSSLAACGVASPTAPVDAGPPASLRAQLAEPIHLAIDPRGSTGQITAQEHAGSDWLPAEVALAIDDGGLELASRDADELVLHAFEVDLAPIALPMLPGDAYLTGVSLRLPAPATLGVTWHDNDDAIAIATLDLELVWSLSANGGTLPLATQPLAAVPFAIALRGAHGTATASIGVDQPGQLWTWADLLALDDLALQLPAATAPGPLQ